MSRVFVGPDWAEGHHDVHVEDVQGKRLAGGRLPEGVEGWPGSNAMVASFAEEREDVVVATETDRGLLIGALVASGYQVLAVNRCRRRAIGSGTRPRARSGFPDACRPSPYSLSRQIRASAPNPIRRSPNEATRPRRLAAWLPP